MNANELKIVLLRSWFVNWNKDYINYERDIQHTKVFVAQRSDHKDIENASKKVHKQRI